MWDAVLKGEISPNDGCATLAYTPSTSVHHWPNGEQDNSLDFVARQTCEGLHGNVVMHM